MKRNAVLAVFVFRAPSWYRAAWAGRGCAPDRAHRGPANTEPSRLGSLYPARTDGALRIPGVSIAVIKDNQIHWAKGYGQADVTAKSPVTTETLFQAASISKPVTAFAVMRLVDAGKLSLDEDVNRYLKSWKVPDDEFTHGRPVTLRALLSHTSGTGDGFGFPGYAPSAERPTLVQILNGEKPSNVGRVFWERPPFTAYKYSGGGTVVVQLLLTDTLGKPFHEIMRELVLEPVGMTSSTYEQPLPPQRDSNAARATMDAAARWMRSGTSIPSRRPPAYGRRQRISRSWPSKCRRHCGVSRGCCRARRRRR